MCIRQDCQRIAFQIDFHPGDFYSARKVAFIQISLSNVCQRQVEDTSTLLQFRALRYHREVMVNMLKADFGQIDFDCTDKIV